MPYFVISNFSSGRDLRRSAETAPSGSLRVLRNAFINEGGEIEKRKAWVRQEEMTAYGQMADYKGRITGPFTCPTAQSVVFFRHRDDSLPGAPFAAGAGTVAAFVEDLDPVTNNSLQKFWVQKSTAPLTALRALFHGASASEFATNSYVVEAHVEPTTLDTRYQHINVAFTGDEPTGEAIVAANADRVFQRVLKNKGYVVKGQTIYGSAVGNPADMAGTGFWVSDLTTQGTPIGEALAIGDYFGQLVIFGTRGMMFWQVDPDPALNQYLRTVEGSVFAARAITGYGAGDILYLSRSGIRSLQARDSSNLARVSDVGSPIDRDIRIDLMADTEDTDPLFGNVSPEISNALFYGLATGIVHQDSGQFWMALKNRIHVLSRYPSSKVLAWSTFDLPEPEFGSTLSGDNKAGWVADWCDINETVVMRNFADEVYVYGGPSGGEYDDAEVEVILPFMDMGRPGSNKVFRGLDIVCEGEWAIDFTTDDTGDDRDLIWSRIAVTDGGTRSAQRIFFEAQGPHIAIRMTTRSDRAARISEVLIHYNEGAQR